MGGGGSAIQNVFKDVKEVAKNVVKQPKNMFDAGKGIIKGENVGSNIKKFSRGMNSLASAGMTDVLDKAGISKGIYDPGGEQIGGIAKSFYDKPKQAKADMAEATKNAAAAQEAQLEKVKAREDQEAAEEEASDTLIRKRRRQRKAYESGRSGNILTNKLGGNSSESGRKSLLGS